jgi:hypothetical protein
MWSSYEAVFDAEQRRWVHEDATFNLCAPQQHPICHSALDVVDHLTRIDQQLPSIDQLKERIGAPHPDLSEILNDWHWNWWQWQWQEKSSSSGSNKGDSDEL